MRISDWSSDVCSSDLLFAGRHHSLRRHAVARLGYGAMSRLIVVSNRVSVDKGRGATGAQGGLAVAMNGALRQHGGIWFGWSGEEVEHFTGQLTMARADGFTTATIEPERSEEHTSEL